MCKYVTHCGGNGDVTIKYTIVKGLRFDSWRWQTLNVFFQFDNLFHFLVSLFHLISLCVNVFSPLKCYWRNNKKKLRENKNLSVSGRTSERKNLMVWSSFLCENSDFFLCPTLVKRRKKGNHLSIYHQRTQKGLPSFLLAGFLRSLLQLEFARKLWGEYRNE